MIVEYFKELENEENEKVLLLFDKQNSFFFQIRLTFRVFANDLFTH